IIPETGEIKEGCIRCQTKQVMKNLQAVLEAAGTDFTKVIKSTCFLADINDFAAFNEVYGEFITDKPARSCVAVKDLPKGVKVEVELIADLD
ncbi:Rid family detoxifying hydrolase, partial [Faecalibaculum rodentium]